MSKKFELSINSVWAINQNSTVLRSFTGFNIDLANKINAISVGLISTIKQIGDIDDLLAEKRVEILKMVDGDEKTKAIGVFEEDNKKENKKKYKVELPVLKMSDFVIDDKHIEIIGAKEVEQQNGSIKKFDYRDAFYGLVNDGLIVE